MAGSDAILVVAALNMAAATRGGDLRGVIFPGDRGSEYTSRNFARACHRWGVTRSMDRVGSCFANAASEASNSVLTVEYVHRHTFPPPHRDPDQACHLNQRLLQHPPTTQHARVQKPDRLRERVPSQPHRRTGCVGRTPQLEGIDILTDAPFIGSAQFLEARHRGHATVEDHIRCGKTTGFSRFPSRHFPLNVAWLELSLAAIDLLGPPAGCAAWSARNARMGWSTVPHRPSRPPAPVAGTADRPLSVAEAMSPAASSIITMRLSPPNSTAALIQLVLPMLQHVSYLPVGGACESATRLMTLFPSTVRSRSADR
jgi:hypothetical protein